MYFTSSVRVLYKNTFNLYNKWNLATVTVLTYNGFDGYVGSVNLASKLTNSLVWIFVGVRVDVCARIGCSNLCEQGCCHYETDTLHANHNAHLALFDVSHFSELNKTLIFIFKIRTVYIFLVFSIWKIGNNYSVKLSI